MLRAVARGLFLDPSSAAAAEGTVLPPAAIRFPRILPYDEPSTRGLLASARSRRSALGALSGGSDTLRVLLVRVSFESDRLDALSSLSTGGDFDLSPSGDSLIDPAPHDRGYFASHLEGLANYYRSQSCGRLEIVGEVIPAAEEGSYRLSDPADYGPGLLGSWTRDDIVRFFRDCIFASDRGLAEEGYPVRFGDYDAVIVAHAGSNFQCDVAGDTPNDPPTCFISLLPGEEVSVDGGAAMIREGCIVPETASQDGLLAGIAGLVAHEFGHQLGLPDLYDTRERVTTVGYFDLMDNGCWVGAYLPGGDGALRYAMGFIPGGLSSWTLSTLGWAEVDAIADGPGALALPALGKCPPRAARIEHAGDEHFLVENRAAELDGILTGFVRDSNGVIVGTGNCLNCDGEPAEEPVWELVNGYDLLLPTERAPDGPTSGPGILVWRVNDRLVAERRESNVLNAERPLAVMLLEADGVVDIGDPASPHSYGWYADAYFAGGNAALGEETNPSSLSAWGVPTGVSASAISARDTLMLCEGAVFGVETAAAVPGSAVLAEGGFFFLPESEDIFLLHSGGDGVIVPGGDTVVSIGRPVLGPPAWLDALPGMDGPGVVVGERAGYIHVFARSTWAECEGWPAFIEATLATHPVVVRRGDRCRIAAAGRRSIHILDGGGEAPGSPIYLYERDITSNLVVAENEDGFAVAVFFVTSPDDDAVIPTKSFLLFKWDLFPDGASEVMVPAEGYPIRLPLEAEDGAEGFFLVGGDLAPAESGDEVFVICRATGRILTCGDRGVLAGRAGEGPVPGAPALSDLNGDSSIDLVYSDGNSIYALSPSLASLRGWPRRIWSLQELPWQSRFSTPVTIASSGVERNVVAGSDGGLLYILDRDGALESGFPRKAAAAFDRAVEMGPPGAGQTLASLDGGLVRLRTAPFAPDFERSWPTLWGNAGRTAWASGADGTGGGLASIAGSLVVYPNPSRGERVGFHFTAPSEGDARLEILTLTGDLVLARTKRLLGGEDEFVVSMNDRAPGVYLSRLVVTSGGRRAETFRKFAIVR